LKLFDERWPREAEELGEALADILAKECPPDTLRAMERGDTEVDPEGKGRIDRLDRALNEFGLWELPPDPYLLTRAAVALGAHLAPVPFVSTAPALALLGEQEIANGVDRAVVPATVARVVIAIGSGLGIAPMPSEVRRSAAGETVAVVAAVNSEPATGDPEAFRAWGFLLESAQLVGAAQALLRYGVDYVKTRRQFGVPVGSFQGVAHPLADAATALQSADLLTRHAAYLAASDGAVPLFAAAMAAAKSRAASRQVAATVHQALGGYGFTVEADCQLYSRRIRAWSSAMPDPGPWLTQLARTLADPATRDHVTDLWQFDRGFTLPRWALTGLRASHVGSDET
jgi:Acyl-CoA dehydrogenase, C-terminal domain